MEFRLLVGGGRVWRVDGGELAGGEGERLS